MAEEDKEIPASGAVFTFGRSRFADNIPSHFFIRNDPVIDVGCGDEHTTVVCQNGRVFAFGSNEWGQLGLGHRSVVTKPSCVKSLKPEQATHVACGRAHTIISTASGKVFAYGANSEGQLGIGDTTDRDSPVALEGITGPVEQLAAGCHHSAALNNKGEVFVWGSNADGQLGLGPDVKTAALPSRLPLKESIARIACGYYHTVLLTEEGQILVCGEGEAGKLGLGSTSTVFNPTHVPLDAWPIYVAAGGNHTLAVAVDGKVYGWGSNLNGQLGLPSSEQTDYLCPVLIDSLTDKVIKEAACGESHTAFVSELGELLTCGETRHGKLGCEINGSDLNSNSEPTRVPRFKPYCVAKVRCGGCHTMVLATPRTEDTDDHLSNGHAANTLQPPEIDLVSPPMGARGPLPPLQRVPHINSTDENISRASSSLGDSGLMPQDVPEVTVDPVTSTSDEAVDSNDKDQTSQVKSTPEFVSVNEKSREGQEEDSKSIITLNQPNMYDKVTTEAEAVVESCEKAVSDAKSKIGNVVNGENGVTSKFSSIQKKSKMCALL